MRIRGQPKPLRVVGDQQTQAVGCMHRRVQNLDFDIADIEQLSVPQWQEVVVHLSCPTPEHACAEVTPGCLLCIGDSGYYRSTGEAPLPLAPLHPKRE